MIENSLKMGEVFQDHASKMHSSLLKEVRGRGLFRCIELEKNKYVDANDLATELMKLGLLTKATHDYMIRLAPALTINDVQIRSSVKIIRKALTSLYDIKRDRKTIYLSEKKGENKDEKDEKEVKVKKVVKKAVKEGKKEGDAIKDEEKEAAKKEDETPKEDKRKKNKGRPPKPKAENTADATIVPEEDNKIDKEKKEKTASL